MAKSFEELRDKALKGNAKAIAKMEARTKAKLAAYLLGELRHYVGLTQKQLAGRLGISQPAVASMEKQEDMKLATLRNVVTALGGVLRISVEMPGGRAWQIAFRADRSTRKHTGRDGVRRGLGVSK